MPYTKEQKKEYNKKYNQSDKGKKLRKEYNKSEKGKKINTIKNWKRLGLVWTSEEEKDEIYDRYLASEKCERKGCEYTEKNWKCMDHEHLLGDFGQFRNILCNSCNSNEKSNNTSGVPNVSEKKDGWEYKKMVNGKRHTKYFKTFEEACDYKIDYEENT